MQRGLLDAVPIVAPLPASLLEGSLVSPGLLAQIVVSKYCDHLPLYRQESIYWSRHQVWLPRQTMAEWVELAAEWLQPIYQQIQQGVLGRGYALNQWPSLLVFLEDGRLEIDNNLIENAIRPTAVGKKNWLFVGGAQAGQRSAIIYSVIECCRRRGLAPFAYLCDVFTRLPSMTNWQVKDLTPEAWAKTQQRTDPRAIA